MGRVEATIALEGTRRRHSSVEELLREVFQTAATAGQARSVLLAQILGRMPGARSEFTPLEVATEAVNLRGLALRAAGFMGARALVAVYEYPTDTTIAGEERAIRLCAQYCRAKNERITDTDFAADAVRDYAGKRMQRTYVKWGKRLHKSPRTLQRWATSKFIGDHSVMQTMDTLIIGALGRVEIALADRGIAWLRDG